MTQTPTARAPVREAVYPEGVTQVDHMAHDMRKGRFPQQSSIETFLAERNSPAAEREAWKADAYDALCKVLVGKTGLSAIMEVQRLKDAERKAPGGVAVPKGWKLVPVRPTDDMINEAGRALYRLRHSRSTKPRKIDALERAVFRAMLAAAPSPPANIGGDSPSVLIAEIEAIRKEWNDPRSSCRASAHKLFTRAEQLGLLATPTAEDKAS